MYEQFQQCAGIVPGLLVVKRPTAWIRCEKTVRNFLSHRYSLDDNLPTISSLWDWTIVSRTDTFFLDTVSSTIVKLNFTVYIKFKMSYIQQRIIESTGTETFANKLRLVKLFRDLKSMPLWCYKNMPMVFLVCNPKFAAFCCFAAW